MNVGLDQFSFHRFYGDVFPWEDDPGVRWTLVDFLDRAEALGVKLVGLHAHYFTRDESARLKGLLSGRGLTCILEWGHPDGLKMGTSTEAIADLLYWFRIAVANDCKLVRIVGGYPTWRGREPVQAQMERLLPVLRRLSNDAKAHGLTLAIENHADFTPQELVELVDRVNNDTLQICFDTGNGVRLGADLIQSARRVASHTAMVHLKDLRPLESSRGNPNASWPSAPLGQGEFDLPRVITTMQNNGFDGPWLIELAQMHPDCPDEQTSVEQSVRWLRDFSQTGKRNCTWKSP